MFLETTLGFIIFVFFLIAVGLVLDLPALLSRVGESVASFFALLFLVGPLAFAAFRATFIWGWKDKMAMPVFCQNNS